MAMKALAAIVALGWLAAASPDSCAAEPASPAAGVALSPGLTDLLRQEMREIAAGVQGIGLALATADWKMIEETSARIRASYIMEKRLTPAQVKELDERLPDEFKRMDLEFHQRAERLGHAAEMRDPEAVAFQYSRLLESCTQCHADYAAKQFPGFAPPEAQRHSH